MKGTHSFTYRRIQDEYAMRKGTTSPIFMKTIDEFGELRVDIRKDETAPMDDRRRQVPGLHHV
jgi:hypothetical protein